MKIQKQLYIKCILFVLLLANNINGQIQVYKADELESLKKGTTYIVMKDPNSEIAKEYVKIYKAYWTFSKIKFIKYSEIDKYLARGNSFLPSLRF